MISIGLLGCGMVGQTWLRHIPWRELGMTPLVYDPQVIDFPSVETVSEPTALATSEMVLVFVGGSVASAAVQSIYPADGPGPREVLDFSSNGARAKHDLSVWCAQRGTSYVDVTILGSVAVLGVRTPLALAGTAPTQPAQALLDSSDAPLTVLSSGAPGDAARLKLVRSVVMKGLEALACEAYEIAGSLRLEAAYDEAFRDVDISGFSTLLSSMVATHEESRRRRGIEVRESLQLVSSLNRSSALLEAVARNYEKGSFRSLEGGCQNA